MKRANAVVAIGFVLMIAVITVGEIALVRMFGPEPRATRLPYLATTATVAVNPRNSDGPNSQEGR